MILRCAALIVLLSFLIIPASLRGTPTDAAQQPSGLEPAVEIRLGDFEKEIIAGIREITLQLILIAAGVAAIVGGFVSGERKQYTRRKTLGGAFVFLSLSIVGGLLCYGRLINVLTYDTFSPYGLISVFAVIQWVSFAIGGMLFMRFVYINISGS